MVVTWNSILLNEVDSEEEAFREIRRFIDASQLPAQTVHIEEGFVCDDTDFFSHRDFRNHSVNFIFLKRIQVDNWKTCINIS